MNLALRTLLLFCGVCGIRVFCEELPAIRDLTPPDCLQRLRSEEFQTRETAQKELLDWTKQNGDAAVSMLVERSATSDDPETRSRCLAVLREIAMEDFGSEGEGYIGINMLDVFVAVPGDPLPRAGIRVGVVVEDSAAAEAGILAGDVIIGLGDEVWREFPISEKFGSEIRAIKPKTKIALKVMRGEKLLNLDVVLRRRPPIPKTFLQLEDPDLDLQSLSKAEQDTYFRNWLKTRRLKK